LRVENNIRKAGLGLGLGMGATTKSSWVSDLETIRLGSIPKP